MNYKVTTYDIFKVLNTIGFLHFSFQFAKRSSCQRLKLFAIYGLPSIYEEELPDLKKLGLKKPLCCNFEVMVTFSNLPLHAFRVTLLVQLSIAEFSGE